MQIKGIDFPDELYYDQKHGWARVEGNTLIQGLSDFGQKIAQEIVFVGFPKEGREVVQGETFLSLESGKWVGRVPAMASGKVLQVNDELEEEPSLVNDSPYEDGWFVTLQMSNPIELDKLMRADTPEFEAFILSEFEANAKYLKKR